MKPDSAMLMKYLADINLTDTNLILSLFDFGGQEVFNIIHHLFLTSYGIYILVFRMEDLADENTAEKSLAELSNWINSIVMHTSKLSSGRCAPVLLVGTQKDIVSDYETHKVLSEKIESKFKYNIVWSSIIENQDLCFFPVNNLIGLEDETIVSLMNNIEDIAKNADYVKEPRPLYWLKAWDELLATKKSFLTLDEASTIAIENGVDERAVHLFLLFLHEMGVVLWLNEEGLRDIVILDVITFFVEPATLIICNHISTPLDSTIHHQKIQTYCKKMFRKDWDQMITTGVLSQKLMEALLGSNDQVQFRQIPVIVNMMLKYGLIVRLQQTSYNKSKLEQQATQPTDRYLVPALLPRVEDHPTTFQNEIWNNVQHFESCYFLFTTDPKLNNQKGFTCSQLKTKCFLPRGLVERLIGKAVMWSQLTCIDNIHEIPQLYQNHTVLSYGRQLFRFVVFLR